MQLYYTTHPQLETTEAESRGDTNPDFSEGAHLSQTKTTLLAPLPPTERVSVFETFVRDAGLLTPHEVGLRASLSLPSANTMAQSASLHASRNEWSLH